LAFESGDGASEPLPGPREGVVGVLRTAPPVFAFGLDACGGFGIAPIPADIFFLGKRLAPVEKPFLRQKKENSFLRQKPPFAPKKRTRL
jgi:hypothetical protein